MEKKCQINKKNNILNEKEICIFGIDNKDSMPIEVV